jgi:hypothetical protein
MDAVNINMDAFKKGMDDIIRSLNVNAIIRPTIAELVGKMKRRIHVDGKASDGSAIGEYQDSYLAIRKRHKRKPGKMVILVLTRKLEESWTIVPTDDGWAVGFNDEGAGGASLPSFARFDSSVSAMDKVVFAEMHFGKKIFELTAEELQFATDGIIEDSTKAIEDAGT